MTGLLGQAARPPLWRRLAVLRRLLLPLGLSAILCACAMSQDGDALGNPSSERQAPKTVGQMLSQLREDSRLRETAVVFCAAALRETEGYDHEPFMAGFFDVSRSESGITLCQVVIEAVISEELTESDMAKIEDPQGHDDYVFFGRVLRKLLVVQERLGSQQVGHPPIVAQGPRRPLKQLSLPE